MTYLKSKIIKEDIENITKDLGIVAHQLSGKTVLLSGGAGFLGKYFVWTIDYLNEHILKKPCKLIIIDNFIVSKRNSIIENENIKIIEHDISKPIKINENIDYIINAASIASPIFYHKFRTETIDVGFLGTKNMLEIAREKNIKSFLFFSSSEIYGDPDPKCIPTSEDYRGNVSCISSRACYDEPKRIGETLCVTYADKFNLPVKIVRPFNIFGPGMRLDDGRVIPAFVLSALKGENMPLHGHGKHTRTFCYISNAIKGFLQILLSDHNREVFNLGHDDQEIQMIHVAELILGLVGNPKAKIQSIEGIKGVHTVDDPTRRCPDLTKIRTVLGYNPKINLVNGLKRFISWVQEEQEKQVISCTLVENCRICNNNDLKKVISLGKTPLANSLLSEEELGYNEELYPLEVMYCNNCHLSQLSCVVSPEIMFGDYPYVTSTTETFKKHFSDMAEKISKEFNLNNGSLAIDIGSNDGLILKKFKELGIRVIGIEPAKNIVEIARKDGIDTINDFLNENVVEDIIRIKGKADVITANNVFAHINNIKEVTDNVKSLLKDNGIFVIEVQYLIDNMRNLTFDNIYHEHLSYFTVTSLNEFFKRQNMEILKVEHNNSHGGSLRVFTQKNKSIHSIDNSVYEFLEKEKIFGVNKIETYEMFAKQVYNIRTTLQEFIRKIKKENKRIVGYGSPAKATTLLNFCGFNSNDINYIIDDNKLKQGKTVPGVRIPITNKEMVEKVQPDYMIILAWNFAEEIIRKNEKYQKQGIKFIIPLPKPTIIESQQVQETLKISI